MCVVDAVRVMYFRYFPLYSTEEVDEKSHAVGLVRSSFSDHKTSTASWTLREEKKWHASGEKAVDTCDHGLLRTLSSAR